MLRVDRAGLVLLALLTGTAHAEESEIEAAEPEAQPGLCQVVGPGAATTEVQTRSQAMLLPSVSEGELPELMVLMQPGHLYRERLQPYPGADGPSGSLDSLSFLILILGDHAHQGGIVSVEWSLCLGDETLETHRLSSQSLRSRVHPLVAEQDPSIWSSSHHLLLPGELEADALVYRLIWADEASELSYRIPVSPYSQQTSLRLPVDGPALVVAGHDAVEHHRAEGSQWFALDIMGVHPRTLATVRKAGKKTHDNFHGWGMKIVAPADGVVVRVVNTVPDNPQAGEILEADEHPELADQVAAVSGNHVVIDHGNGEFSFLGHLQQGSIPVSEGERILRGELVGRMGNSGNSTGPHLHYHLMACGEPLRCNGLPVRFDDVDIYYEPPFESYAPVRGTVLIPE